LILLALSTGGERSFAASGREDRAYAAQRPHFRTDVEPRGTEFAQFVQKYPKSDRVAEAVLLQAEAEFKQGKLPPASACSRRAKPKPGISPTNYVY